MLEFDFADISLVVLLGAFIWQAYVISRLQSDVVGLADRVFDTQNEVQKILAKERKEKAEALTSHYRSTHRQASVRESTDGHNDDSDFGSAVGMAAIGAVAGYGAASLFDDSDSPSSSGSYDCGSDFGDSCGDV